MSSSTPLDLSQSKRLFRLAQIVVNATNRVGDPEVTVGAAEGGNVRVRGSSASIIWADEMTVTAAEWRKALRDALAWVE